MSALKEHPIPVGIGIIRRADRFLVRRRPAGTVYGDSGSFPVASASRANPRPPPRLANASRRPD